MTDILIAALAWVIPVPKRKMRTPVPGVAELFRTTMSPPAEADERQATGRERHDQKITVYLSAAELLDLEHARLRLRRLGVVIDRGRLVREAIAVLLADLDARGADSVIARRISAVQPSAVQPSAVQPSAVQSDTSPSDTSQSGPSRPGPGRADHQDNDEDRGLSQPAVPSLAWERLLVPR